MFTSCSLRPLQAKHKAEPHNYIEFFLVTGEGQEVLAVTAEDHGNAHYVCVRGWGASKWASVRKP